MPLGEKTKLLWQDSEYRKHMSEVHKGNAGYWTGKKLYPHMIKALSKARKGKPSWNKGIPMAEDSRIKMRDTFKRIGKTFTKLTPKQEQKRLIAIAKAAKGRIGKYAGENCCHWRGGISKLPYSALWTEQLKEKVRVRDNFQCQLCKIPELEFKHRLSIHHIDYDKKNCALDNLICLCNQCHTKTNFNRRYYENLFKEFLCK